MGLLYRLCLRLSFCLVVFCVFLLLFYICLKILRHSIPPPNRYTEMVQRRTEEGGGDGVGGGGWRARGEGEGGFSHGINSILINIKLHGLRTTKLTIVLHWQTCSALCLCVCLFCKQRERERERERESTHARSIFKVERGEVMKKMLTSLSIEPHPPFSRLELSSGFYAAIGFHAKGVASA